MRRAALAFGVGISLLACLSPRPARAFERQWHLGAAAGVTKAHGLGLSPALGAYAAYGLSDVFDTRLELTARGYGFGNDGAPHALSAMAGLAYKLDVLSWVPWAGVYAGYLGHFELPRPGSSFRQHDAALGLGFGLDYSLSRELGLGASVRLDQALVGSQATSFEALLRAEYRWGW